MASWDYFFNIKTLGVLLGSSFCCDRLLLLQGICGFKVYCTCREYCIDWDNFSAFAGTVEFSAYVFCQKNVFRGRGEKNPEIRNLGTLLFALPIIIFLASPNVKHAQNYHSHVVYPSKTIEVFEALEKASEPDDFVVTWWDYGSGCWYYGGLRSFTSPAHQTYDNYLTSEILRSDSPLQASGRLARLKTETFVDLQRKAESGKTEYNTAVRSIFKDGQSDSEFYQGLLSDLGNASYDLPSKSRDMFLFLPYEILRIFPTILSFSSSEFIFFLRILMILGKNILHDHFAKCKKGRLFHNFRWWLSYEPKRRINCGWCK